MMPEREDKGELNADKFVRAKSRIVFEYPPQMTKGGRPLRDGDT